MSDKFLGPAHPKSLFLRMCIMLFSFVSVVFKNISSMTVAMVELIMPFSFVLLILGHILSEGGKEKTVADFLF